MSITDHLNYVISELAFRDTDWVLDTAANGSVTISDPLPSGVSVGVAVEGGCLWVKRRSDPSSSPLIYGGVGGSVSVSVFDSPVNVTFATTDMLVVGKIYALPASGRSLTRDEFSGALVWLEANVDAGPGVAYSAMFLGGSLLLAAMVTQTPPPFGLTFLPALIASSEAVLFSRGDMYTVVPYNASVNVFIGMIH